MIEQDVFSYRPSVFLKKKIQTNVNEKSYYDLLNVDDSLLKQFLDNRLMYTLNNLNNTRKLVQSFIDTVKNDLIASNNDEYMLFVDSIDKGILEKHSNDIKGDVSIEVYNELNNILNEIEALESVFKKAYFGDESISTEKAIKIEEEMINKIFDLYNKSKEKINYAAIYSDTKINKITNTYIDIENEYANNLMQLHLFKEKETPNAQDNIIDTMFDKVSKTNITDRIKLNKIYKEELIKNSLISSINNRNKMLEALNKVDKLVEIADDDYKDSVLSMINDIIEESNKTLIDYNKAIILGTMYKEDYLNTLKEKQKIKKMLINLTK